MKPFNIFSQSAILFLLGTILLLRSHSTNNVDKWMGCTTIVFAVIRLIEFLSIKMSSEESARSVATLMWLVPFLMLVCCMAENKRFDTLVFIVLSVIGFVFYFVKNATVFTDHYYLVSPDRGVGNSSGLFSWLHTGENDNILPLFLPVTFYVMLMIAVIYSISSFVSNISFWVLFSSIVIGSIIGVLIISNNNEAVNHYFWSLFSFIMIAVSTIAIFLIPG